MHFCELPFCWSHWQQHSSAFLMTLHKDTQERALRGGGMGVAQGRDCAGTKWQCVFSHDKSTF